MLFYFLFFNLGHQKNNGQLASMDFFFFFKYLVNDLPGKYLSILNVPFLGQNTCCGHYGRGHTCWILEHVKRVGMCQASD